MGETATHLFLHCVFPIKWKIPFVQRCHLYSFTNEDASEILILVFSHVIGFISWDVKNSSRAKHYVVFCTVLETLLFQSLLLNLVLDIYFSEIYFAEELQNDHILKERSHAFM